MTLHNALFDKNSNKFVFEKNNVRNKKSQGNTNSILDLNGVPPSKIVQINKATGEALKMYVGGNAILNYRIKELEIALMSPPIFSYPITTMHPWKTLH
jgi:hypothetical protein